MKCNGNSRTVKVGGREGALVMGVCGDDSKNYERMNREHEISTSCARNMWILAQFILEGCADDWQLEHNSYLKFSLASQAKKWTKSWFVYKKICMSSCSYLKVLLYLYFTSKQAVVSV